LELLSPLWSGRVLGEDGYPDKARERRNCRRALPKRRPQGVG